MALLQQHSPLAADCHVSSCLKRCGSPTKDAFSALPAAVPASVIATTTSASTSATEVAEPPAALLVGTGAATDGLAALGSETMPSFAPELAEPPAALLVGTGAPADDMAALGSNTMQAFAPVLAGTLAKACARGQKHTDRQAAHTQRCMHNVPPHPATHLLPETYLQRTCNVPATYLQRTCTVPALPQERARSQRPAHISHNSHTQQCMWSAAHALWGVRTHQPSRPPELGPCTHLRLGPSSG